MEKDVYTIRELAEQAGTTSRTIRFYTAEGLLPSPDARGKYALYTNEHRDRLLLIGRLKEAFWPLNAIREHLNYLGSNEIRGLLANTVPPSPAQPGVSGEDPMKGLSAPRGSAAEYISRVLAAANAPPVSRSPTIQDRPMAPSSMLSRQAAPRLRAANRLDAITVKESSPVQTWDRLEIDPGVEIHIRLPVSPDRREYIDRLIAFARSSRAPS